MNKKIVIIGAGVGGVAAAEFLGKLGNEVVVFEKSERGSVSFDWHDDVNPHVFDKVGVGMPDSKYCKRKGNWAFVPPDESTAIEINLPEEKLDFSIERRPLAEYLIARAEKYADFRFGAKVDSLLIENGIVCGIKIGNESIKADLVIDNSGVLSPFRGMLPASYKIAAMPEKDEMFKAYRAFYTRNQNAALPKYSNPVYMKHLGEKGISWCLLDPFSDSVNVLIGRIGELNKPTLDNALKKLKASNPIIGDKILRGGGVYSISVRHPATRMSGEGYVMIGDSAYQTIPMLGSGIEAGLVAAFTLANVVKRTGSVDRDTLWQYQAEYYREMGAAHFSTDLLKRFLLDISPEDIGFLFTSGVVDEKDLEAAAVGGNIKIGFSDLIHKVIKGISNVKLLLKLKTVLDKGTKVQKIAGAIPAHFDEESVTAWETRLLKYFK